MNLSFLRDSLIRAAIASETLPEAAGSRIARFLWGMKILSPRRLSITIIQISVGDHGLFRNSGIDLERDGVYLGLVLRDNKIYPGGEGRGRGLRRQRNESPVVDNDRAYL